MAALFFISVLVAIAGIACMFLFSDDGHRLTLPGLGLLVFAAALFILSLVRVVPANSVAIPVTFGKAGHPVGPGLRFSGPFTSMRSFSTRVQVSSRLANAEGDKDKVDCVEVAASDGAVLCVDATVRYVINTDNADSIRSLYRRYGSFDRVRDVLVRREAEEALKSVFGTYTPEAAVSGETAARLTSEAKSALAVRFEIFGLRVDSVAIGRVHVSDAVQARIDEKIKARQDADRAKIVQDRAVTEAETKRKQAEIAAKEAVAKAQGDAEAARIRAQGEADANRTIAASLTPDLLQRLYYEALARTKQLIVGANGSSVLVGGAP